MEAVLALLAVSDVFIVDAEDRTYRATDLSVSKEGEGLFLTFQDAAGARHRMNCRDLVEMSFQGLSPRARPEPLDVRVRMTNGDALVGTVARPARDAFVLRSPHLGEATVELAMVDSIEFLANRSLIRPPVDLKGFDLIQFASGNFDRGTIVGLSPQGIEYRDEKNQTFPMGPDKIAAVYLMRTREPPPEPSDPFAIVTLVDESVLRGSIERIEGGMLELRTQAGVLHKILAGSLSSVHFKNGRVAYLSDLTPSSVDEDANYIRGPEKGPSDLDMPFQRDRSVKGTKLLIRRREFKKGLGVHARSDLQFAIDGRYDRFLAWVGVDDVTGGLGNVLFEVTVDGAKVYSSGACGRDEPKAISIPVAGAKRLGLSVLFGEETNTGACADWAMARLIRK